MCICNSCIVNEEAITVKSGSLGRHVRPPLIKKTMQDGAPASIFLCLPSCLFPTFLITFNFPMSPSCCLFSSFLSPQRTDLFLDSSFLWLGLKQEFYLTGCWSTSANVREFQHDKQERIWNTPPPPSVERMISSPSACSQTGSGQRTSWRRGAAQPRAGIQNFGVLEVLAVPLVMYIHRGNVFTLCLVKRKSSL